MQDLNDLFYFASVVDHRGFAPAARALGVPKSSLSRRIARLEDRLGVRLLERTTRRFSVTEVGQDFYRRSRAVIEEAEAAEEAVARVRAEPQGLVRVSCPPGSALVSALADGLPALLETWPKLRVQLVISNRRVDLIEEGVDVAVRVRERLDTDAALQMKALGRSRELLVASPAFLNRYGRPTAPEDLARRPTLGHTERPGAEVWTLTGPDGRQASVEHHPRLSSADFGVLLQGAYAGTGMALLPEVICSDALRDGTLERVLPDWSGGEGIVHLVFTSRRGLLPGVRAVIDFLAETIRCSVSAHRHG